MIMWRSFQIVMYVALSAGLDGKMYPFCVILQSFHLPLIFLIIIFITALKGRATEPTHIGRVHSPQLLPPSRSGPSSPFSLRHAGQPLPPFEITLLHSESVETVFTFGSAAAAKEEEEK